MSAGKDIRHPNRFITGHNATGKAIFENELDETLPITPLPANADFGLCYTTKGFPIELNDNADIQVYKSFLQSPPGITVSNGSVIRMVDMPPGVTSPMHRTVSLDYGVVLEGEVELILDSGEKRLMKRGDVSIQRGTNHAWKNMSGEHWARMLYVLLPVKPIEIGGQKFGEASDIPGVRPSD
ncbi:cupin domain protein [Phyllosticta citricarpa]|uniref:Cupin domain protein n=2 Tax=Phyllosticta TaxID=121621 RepID=A0ABR1LR98_9PEZI